MRRRAEVLAFCALLTFVGTLPACFLAAAGAGAGGAIYFTSRGAESLIDASVEEVAAAVEVAFAELDIQETKTTAEREGDERQVEGKKGDLDVKVEFERQSRSTTRVEVTARENVAEWDKDYAKRVLEIIVARS